jgi:hypothetical protein
LCLNFYGQALSRNWHRPRLSSAPRRIN